MPAMHITVPAIDDQTITSFQSAALRRSGVKYSQCSTAPVQPQNRPDAVVFNTTSPPFSVTYSRVPAASSTAMR